MFVINIKFTKLKMLPTIRCSTLYLLVFLSVQIIFINGVRWYGHVLRKDNGHVLRKVLEFEVKGKRQRG